MKNSFSKVNIAPEMQSVPNPNDRISLNDLPHELLEHVCKNMRAVDLHSLRRVSRKMDDATLPFVLTTVHVFFLQSGFDRLAHVSKHPVFRQQVRTIYYHPFRIRFYRTIFDYRLGVRDRMEPSQFRKFFGVNPDKYLTVSHSKWKECFDEHQRLYDQQTELLKGSCLADLMADPLDAFPKLESVIVAPSYAPYLNLEKFFKDRAPLNHLMRQYVRGGEITDKVAAPGGRLSQHPTAIVNAVARAKVNLSHLSLHFVTATFFEISNLSQHHLQVAFSHVKVFHLYVDLINVTDQWILGLMRLFAFCEALEELCLELALRGHRTISNMVTRASDILGDHSALPNLRSVTLKRGWLRQDPFYRFIANRQPHLTHIDMQNCKFTEGSRSQLKKRVANILPGGSLFSVSKSWESM